MATKYYCDKCEQEQREADELAKLEVPRESGYGAFDSSDSYTKELCKSCLRKLIEWLKVK